MKRMPRLKKPGETQRLNLLTTKEVRQKMEELQAKMGADSLGEVIRRSMAVYDYLLRENEKGSKLVVRSKQGEKEVILL